MTDHERDKPSVLGCMEKVWIFTGLVWKILPHLDVRETWILCALQKDSCLEFKKKNYIEQYNLSNLNTLTSQFIVMESEASYRRMV